MREVQRSVQGRSVRRSDDRDGQGSVPGPLRPV
jgi:hypothetical protein